MFYISKSELDFIELLSMEIKLTQTMIRTETLKSRIKIPYIFFSCSPNINWLCKLFSLYKTPAKYFRIYMYSTRKINPVPQKCQMQSMMRRNIQFAASLISSQPPSTNKPRPLVRIQPNSGEDFSSP